MTAALSGRTGLTVRVTGVVQGVGFRPFVHRLAIRFGLAGTVRNVTGEVMIELEGEPDALDGFVQALRTEAPPLARIAGVAAEPTAARGLAGFSIEQSRDSIAAPPPVAPDVALCPACEQELFDPANRRYRYPFITCTDCGPRYTVIERMPYDRERTSMRAFPQCPACLREYATPGNRRYHSESNSCPVCGPQVAFAPADAPGNGAASIGESALEHAAELLRSGGILALRGLGGFHLAVDATDSAAIDRLRIRKRRDTKPLAVMVRSLEAAAIVAEVNADGAALLTAPERPIVVLERRAAGPLAPEIAPGLSTVGLMLAYTPLHHLLLDLTARPLVMTSGNLSDEPIAAGVVEARQRLGRLADGFLWHDREIVSRCDDSVVRPAGGQALLLRRARGYAPLGIPLPVPAPRPLVAVGPHLKSTFALASGREAFLSPHLGDLENYETLEHFRATLARYCDLFRIAPEVVVHDLHPGYLSTGEAHRFPAQLRVGVQHHHAHIAAVLAEHGETGPAVGIAYDGTGYGPDGRTWGAELIEADLRDFVRRGHLRYAPLPGGDLAARSPWRAALGFLSLEPSVAPAFALAFQGVDPREHAVAAHQIETGLNAPLVSSMGRLFDAAAAVLGVRRVARYEGQAAMELESLAGRRPAAEHPVRITEADGLWIVDPTALLVELGERRLSGEDPADLAADFHASIAWMTALLAERACQSAGLDTVVLGGGVFQNLRLLTSVQHRLERLRLRVLVPRRLSPNDGAISYGQAAVAAARLADGLTHGG